mmetsp:Transcript_33410/g.73060  ORF Transcript_33410/g.73060 Transcript_33410/m.73060 type:complete len:84 (-) Transcript_33410:1717-1968(-)
MIWSACSTVLSLCAMTRTVRFCCKRGDHRALCRACETSRVAVGSSAEVASSSIRTGGSLMSALAMASLCLCPPESFPSATRVL